MAGSAYLLLPISGLVAYFRGATPRVRFHGLQAILLGLLWPVVLIGCSKITPGATQTAFAVGLLVWLGFLLTTLFGLDPRVPIVGRALRRAAEVEPAGEIEL